MLHYVILAAFFSTLFLALSMSAYSETQVGSAILVEIAPPWDVIDQGTAECVIDAIKYAEANNYALILKVDSYGGYLDSGYAIGDAIYKAQVPVIAFVENKALSAGTLIILPANFVIMEKGSIIGAMQPVRVDPVTGEITFINESKILNPIIEKSKLYASKAGRNVTAIESFIVKAATMSSSEAVKYGVADYEVANYYEIFSILDGKEVAIGDRSYRLKLSQGGVREFSCSVRSRFLSIMSNSYLASVLVSIGLLSTIFALVSGKITMLPLTIAILLLGMLASGLNPNVVAAFFIVLGALLLAIELFVIPGFGVIGISGITLLTLGFLLLPMYLPPGYIPTESYLVQIRIFILGLGVTLGGLFGFMIFKVVQVRRKKPIEFTPKDEIGKAVDDIVPGKIGFVMIEGEYWRATSDEFIPKESRVIVVEMTEGGILKVKKVS